jgi:hypothetical protein
MLASTSVFRLLVAVSTVGLVASGLFAMPALETFFAAVALYPRPDLCACCTICEGAGVLHRIGRYRTNSMERDHGFLKGRPRPTRGRKSVA